MSESLHKPHDYLIRNTFSDTVEAASFFQNNLPAQLTNQLEWETLILEDKTFIDEQFKETIADLWYQVKIKNSQKNAFLYILFEHQSKPDKWMPFRLLKYMCRIWDESFKKYPKQTHLIPILPVVFYQGENSWSYSTEFADLFEETELDQLDQSFIPHFTHVLVDQSNVNWEEMTGTLKARIAQLFMFAAYHGLMESLMVTLAELLAQIPLTGGMNYVAIFGRYAGATQDRETVEKLIEMIKNLSPEVGGEMLTAAQEWMLEGERKGERRGKREGKLEGKLEATIENIENFLKAGVGWEVVVNATGVTQEKFQELKQKWQQMSASRTEIPAT